jgi:hypothetical protein
MGAPPAWLVFEPEVTEGNRDLRAGTEIMVLTSNHSLGAVLSRSRSGA